MRLTKKPWMKKNFTLLHWQRRLRGGMLTLNMITQTQTTPNPQVAQILQLFQKTSKKSIKSFELIGN
ncbi:hypothetical protein TNCV_1182551 [Trichonephila clavipes]|nr:hypothetical protein TNCV_1182551 [Trichonephila clavipes]